jgi:Anti-sigma regulatory factor (Ser/Thr protein kinase)
MSADDREVCWDLPADPEFVSKARHMVGELLVTWGMAGLVDRVTLIVSELYTNGLRHGEPPIVLMLRGGGRLLRGEVTDRGGLWPRQGPADPDAEGGRGLSIVDMLAMRWGVDPVAEGSGKTVWFYCELH